MAPGNFLGSKHYLPGGVWGGGRQAVEATGGICAGGSLCCSTAPQLTFPPFIFQGLKIISRDTAPPRGGRF